MRLLVMSDLHLEFGPFELPNDMPHGNRFPLDNYLLPRLEMTEPNLQLAESNGLSLDGYRFETLDFLFSLAAREFEEAA